MIKSIAILQSILPFVSSAALNNHPFRLHVTRYTKSKKSWFVLRGSLHMSHHYTDSLQLFRNTMLQKRPSQLFKRDSPVSGAQSVHTFPAVRQSAYRSHAPPMPSKSQCLRNVDSVKDRHQYLAQATRKTKRHGNALLEDYEWNFAQTYAGQIPKVCKACWLEWTSIHRNLLEKEVVR